MAIFKFSKITSQTVPTKPKKPGMTGTGNVTPIKNKPLEETQLNGLAAGVVKQRTPAINTSSSAPSSTSSQQTVSGFGAGSSFTPINPTSPTTGTQTSGSGGTSGGQAAASATAPTSASSTGNAAAAASGSTTKPQLTGSSGTSQTSGTTSTKINTDIAKAALDRLSGTPRTGGSNIPVTGPGEQNQPPTTEQPPTTQSTAGNQYSGREGEAVGEPPPSAPMNEEVEFGGLNDIARQNIIKMMQEDEAKRKASSDEELGRLQEGEATGLQRAQEVSDVGAMGLTGAGQMMQSDVGRIGRRETTLAMDEFNRRAREEQAQRLAGSIGALGDVQRAQFEQKAFEEAQAALPAAPDIVQNADGTMTQTLENGTVIQYDSAGNEISRETPRNENGTVSLTRSDNNLTKDYKVMETRPDGAISEGSTPWHDADGNLYYLYNYNGETIAVPE